MCLKKRGQLNIRKRCALFCSENLEPPSNCSKCPLSPQKIENFPERGFEPSIKASPALNMVDYTTTAKNIIQIQCSFIDPSIYFSAEKSTFFS